MRALLMLLCLMILCSGASFSQMPYNEIGLYTDMSGDLASVNVMVNLFDFTTVYMVLTNPFNPEFDDGSGNLVGRAVENIGAFESQVRWQEAGVLVSGTEYANGGINFYDAPYYLVGYPTPVPVTSGSAVLVTWTLIALDLDPHKVFMGLFENPTYSDSNAYVDADDTPGADVAPMYPVSGGFDMPVFGINGSVVTVETESWGGVKALYR